MESKRKNIILVGFMGSGKTSVGIKLSYKLRMPVEDTDKLIEKQQRRTISEIFATDGEDAFRQMETKLLEEIAQKNYGRILSVGGGTVVREVNRKLVKQCGTVIYLRAQAETIYERLKGDTTRPLLMCEDPLSRIKAMLSDRASAYEESADIIVDVDGKSMETLVAEIEKKIQQKEEKKMKLLVINGPNLNFLGIREKSVYGTQDFQYLLNMIDQKAKDCGIEIEKFQSNHEGAIIDRIQEAYFDGTDGIVINPGAYTHYSYAIRDALASIVVPKVEIHISDITKREEFRKTSVTKDACDHQIYGQGLEGYLMAIDYILNNSERK